MGRKYTLLYSRNISNLYKDFKRVYHRVTIPFISKPLLLRTPMIGLLDHKIDLYLSCIFIR